MRKRLVIAAVCVLALPNLFSASQTEKSSNANPFATVALAGRTTMGNWCECGTPGDCFCDPGEKPSGQMSRPVSDQNDRSSKHGNTSASADRTFRFDFGSGALMLALTFFLWTRLRG